MVTHNNYKSIFSIKCKERTLFIPTKCIELKIFKNFIIETISLDNDISFSISSKCIIVIFCNNCKLLLFIINLFCPTQLLHTNSPKTRSIFLIDPINPLGSTYPKEEKKAICEVAEDHDIWVIDDITYRDYAPNHTLAADLLPEKTITAYSVSKNCGLAGLRVGSLVGPKDFISDIRGTMVSDLGIVRSSEHEIVSCAFLLVI